MSKREVRCVLAFIVLLLGICVHIRMGFALVNPGQSSKPNIVFILADDLDADSIKFMPRLQSLLVDRGTRFATFFVTNALCCPSRASILTGQYPHNHGVFTDQSPSGGFKKFQASGDENSTIATWLKAAGYRTMLAGKYLNGYSTDAPTMAVPPGWDEWHAVLDESPYTNYDYRLNENGNIVEYGSRPEDYLTDVLARKATEFIQRAGSEVEPFFLYVATHAPHQPATPAPRHEHAFAGATALRPPSFNEEDVSDKPEWVRRRPRLSDADIQKIDELYRKRLQSLLAVDEMLEKIIRTLEARDVLDNTFVFLTSDNGFHMGEHRLPPGKETAYEEDIRVPLIVRGPGVPAGRTIQQLGLNIDLAPTFAEAAGARIPETVDGRSLLPLLGPASPAVDAWRKDFLIEHWATERRPDKPLSYSALRTLDSLYVEYATGERELYDLRQDPYERRSLHRGAPASLLRELAERLNSLRQCKAAACRK